MVNIYKKLIDEILELPGYDLKRIACDFSVSYPSLYQIHSGKTKKPHVPLASALFKMHIISRPDLWGLGSSWCANSLLLHNVKQYDRE